MGQALVFLDPAFLSASHWCQCWNFGVRVSAIRTYKARTLQASNPRQRIGESESRQKRFLEIHEGFDFVVAIWQQNMYTNRLVILPRGGMCPCAQLWLLETGCVLSCLYYRSVVSRLGGPFETSESKNIGEFAACSICESIRLLVRLPKGVL